MLLIKSFCLLFFSIGAANAFTCIFDISGGCNFDLSRDMNIPGNYGKICGVLLNSTNTEEYACKACKTNLVKYAKKYARTAKCDIEKCNISNTKECERVKSHAKNTLVKNDQFILI